MAMVACNKQALDCGPRAWFLEIVSSANVGVCVCVSAPEAINNNKSRERHA